jgi:hypothetical protein
MSSNKRAPKKSKVAAGAESRHKARSSRGKKSSRPSHSNGVSQDFAWKIYESLPESSIVNMLLSSEQFLELCRLESRKASPVVESLHRVLKARGQWLQNDSVYAATVFVRCWPEYRPPKWVMSWIHQAFVDLLEGKGTLGSLMGFSGEGDRASNKARRRENLLVQFGQIARLISLGLSTREAAGLVCSRENPSLRVADDSQSADRLLSMTNTLVYDYNHYPGRNDLKTFYDLAHTSPSAENVIVAFLDDFPRNEILRIPSLRKFLA